MNLDMLGLAASMTAAGPGRAPVASAPATIGDGGDFVGIMAAEVAAGASGAKMFAPLAIGEEFAVDAAALAGKMMSPHGERKAAPADAGQGMASVLPAVSDAGGKRAAGLAAKTETTEKAGETEEEQADGLSGLPAVLPDVANRIMTAIPAVAASAPPVADAASPAERSGTPPAQGTAAIGHATPDGRSAVRAANQDIPMTGAPALPSALPAAPVTGEGAASASSPRPMATGEVLPPASNAASPKGADGAMPAPPTVPRAAIPLAAGEGEPENGAATLAAPQDTSDPAARDAPAAARPGEATSLLNIVKSLLPRRGRESASATPETGQGNRVPAPMTGDMRGLAALSPSPTSVPVAGPAHGMVPTGALSPDPVEVMDAPSPVTREPQAGKAEPDPAMRMATRPVAEEPRDEGVSGEAGDRPAASVPVVSSSPVSAGFDLKMPGLSLPPAGGAAAPLLNGASAAAGIAASLDQRVVDMGVSGQWIDDIARQIATIADNPGRGQFQIASPHLGAVRVDITPGTQGSDIRLTAETEAAQVALMQDKGRLVHDAQIAAVRIGEVRIDRM
ncbi:MAG: hypothetical protein B7Z20_03535, partial [Sphingobium sp. 32-64-5]